MTDVKRSDFHHNFLKSVIVRLDFQGVLESEMEKVLLDVKPFAKEQGFSKCTNKYANQIDIAVMDKGVPEFVETTNRVRRQKVYSFIDENRGFVLDVSSSFICLRINTTHYTPFSEYCGIIPFVANVYKKNIDFFAVTRFGIRKINECLIFHKAQIKEYFNPAHFNYFDQMDGVNTIQSNHVNNFTRGKYQFKLITAIVQGLVNKNVVYSVRLDIDAYLNKTEDVLLLLENQENQSEINDLIFQIYVSLLTDGFITLLASDNDFDTTNILGVESND